MNEIPTNNPEFFPYGLMENVVKLSVPLTVDCNHGRNWLEAH